LGKEKKTLPKLFATPTDTEARLNAIPATIATGLRKRAQVYWEAQFEPA
jgi:hypothetical protein